jgi:hypothetical protein
MSLKNGPKTGVSMERACPYIAFSARSEKFFAAAKRHEY